MMLKKEPARFKILENIQICANCKKIRDDADKLHQTKCVVSVCLECPDLGLIYPGLNPINPDIDLD